MIVFAFITGLYAILIYLLIIGFDNVKLSKTKCFDEKTEFSIVIPFRNEAETLPILLKSLQEISYSNHSFEILFIDDDSTDNSKEIIHTLLKNSSLSFSILNNQRISASPKKDAIETAISKAQFDWIITTDADCKVPRLWLESFNSFILEKRPKMIVSPVIYKNDSTFLAKFQTIDLLSLQGSTLGGFGIKKPFLCNGANLAYEKKSFHKVKGFTGNNAIASGDDIFLLEKFLIHHKNSVQFLKNEHSIVTTIPVKSWSSLLNQRIRWASKSIAYKNSFSKIVGIIVILINISIIISITLSLIGETLTSTVFSIFITKGIVDFVLIRKTSQFLKTPFSVIDFIISSFVYPIFNGIVAIKSLTSRYEWKGRSFRK